MRNEIVLMGFLQSWKSFVPLENFKRVWKSLTALYKEFYRVQNNSDRVLDQFESFKRIWKLCADRVWESIKQVWMGLEMSKKISNETVNVSSYFNEVCMILDKFCAILKEPKNVSESFK